MKFTQALQIGIFAFVLLVSTASARSVRREGEDCDWYCWVEQRIDELQAQIDQLSRALFPNGNNNQPAQPSVIALSSQSYYPKTFGTPLAPTPSQNPDITTTGVIIKTTPKPTYPQEEPEPRPEESRSGYRALAYFGNWDIYARKFFVPAIPADQLTHLLYAFADNTDDGTVKLTDSYADAEIHFEGDSWSEPGKNLYGNLKQIGLLKQQHRNLKVLLSVGGWTYTNEKKHFDGPAATEEGRKKFAASCVQLVRDYGFDGIDIDWEYPQDQHQGNQLLDLLKEIRSALDEYASSLTVQTAGGGDVQPRFLLSIAAPAGEKYYKNLPLREIGAVLDFINLMAYDYAGSWDKTSGHASNLFESESNPASTPYNTDSVISYYIAEGVPASKLNLGMPLYGRAFLATKGLGQPYTGNGAGTWEVGVYDYKALPLSGAKEYYDKEAGATYSYDESTGMLVSYDTVDMALDKVDYIKQTGLGGAMWWEVSGDRADEESIISNVVSELGGSDGRDLEAKSNWIYYPDSQYDNVRDGFQKP